MTVRTLNRQLTPREAQIVALVGQGLPNRIIAQELGIATATVKAHIVNIARSIVPAGLTTPKVRILLYLKDGDQDNQS